MFDNSAQLPHRVCTNKSHTTDLALPNHLTYISAKYNRTERLCVNLLTTANCYAHINCIASYAISLFMSEASRNYPTRLETRTKEFNWIASRRV